MKPEFGVDLRHRCLFLFYPNNTVLFTQQPSTHKNRSTSNSNSRKEGKTQCGGVGTVGNEISIARTLETGRRRRFALSNLLYRDGRPSCSFPLFLLGSALATNGGRGGGGFGVREGGKTPQSVEGERRGDCAEKIEWK